MNYNYLSSALATFSTATPELIDNFNPAVITEGSSLLVQVVTAVLAILSFIKGLKKQKS